MIVIGADHPTGAAILGRLRDRGGEVRAFVSDEPTGDRLRRSTVKVAIGDLSDASHIEGAAMNCFCAVLVTEAAGDGRELAFATSASSVYDGWRRALGASRVTRTIWVHPESAVPGDEPDRTPEVATVVTTGRAEDEIADEVAELEDRPAL